MWWIIYKSSDWSDDSLDDSISQEKIDEDIMSRNPK